MPSDLHRELVVAAALARDAGAVLLRLRGGPLDPRHKAGGELVTAADLAADAIIRAGLGAAFGDDVLVSEEAVVDPERLAGGRVWIVDPLDGTRDFAAGGDEFSVSIGLAVDGLPRLGAICAPVRGELFTGAIGEGAWLNGAPVRVTDAADLGSAQITTSRSEWRAGLRHVPFKFSVERFSSAAYKLARVAAGLDDATFSAHSRRDWDVCAGVALVLAAGGRATLRGGGEVRFDRHDLLQPAGIVAAGPALHEKLRAELDRILGEQ